MSLQRLGNEPARRFLIAWVVLALVFSAAVGADVISQLPVVLRAPLDGPDAVDMAASVLGDVGRALGVMLSMLVALCGLAIPLTANVYTPKLIEIFLGDRLNRLVIGYYVIANGVVLWHLWILSGPNPGDIPGRLFVCLALAIVGTVTIAPYVLYVLRFLVPTTIVRRLEGEIHEDLRLACHATEREQSSRAIGHAIKNVQYLGNIMLRSVERYDRDTAFECLQAMRAVFDGFQARKEVLPRALSQADAAASLGLGPELALEVERQRAVVEVAILQELQLVLSLAMQRLPELVARMAALTRHFGKRTAERHDLGPREMVVLYFNTFLRQALKERQPDAFYKFVYQYRRLAEDLLDVDTRLARQIAFFIDYYGHQAVRMGMGYLINVVAYDLASLCDLAYIKEAPGRAELLRSFANLDRDQSALLGMPGVIKAQVILAAKLRTRGEEEPAAMLEAELRKVEPERLREAFSQIVGARAENFWEIADRRRHLDHVEPRFRPAVDGLRRALLGDAPPGQDTLLYLEEAAATPAVPSLGSGKECRDPNLTSPRGRTRQITGKYVRLELEQDRAPRAASTPAHNGEDEASG